MLQKYYSVYNNIKEGIYKSENQALMIGSTTLSISSNTGADT